MKLRSIGRNMNDPDWGGETTATGEAAEAAGVGCDKNDHVRLRHSNRAALPHYFIAAAHASSFGGLI